jgi:hypothetical protein
MSQYTFKKFTTQLETLNSRSSQTISINTDIEGNTDNILNLTYDIDGNLMSKLASNSGVDIGDVDVKTCGAITPGTGSTNLGKAEDAAHSSGDVGVMSLAVRNDTLGALAGTDGDYAPLQVNSSGALHVTSLSKILTNGILLNQAISSGQSYTSSTIDANDYEKVNIWGYINTSGTASTVTIEISHDDSDWYPIQTVSAEYFSWKGMVYYLSVENLQARYFRTRLDSDITRTAKLYYSMK